MSLIVNNHNRTRQDKNWSISSKDMKPKGRDALSYLGVFGGVLYVVLCLTWWDSEVYRSMGALGGATIASLSYLLRDWNSKVSVVETGDFDNLTDIQKWWKRFTYYLFSALGTSLVLASVTSLGHSISKSITYLMLGGVIVYYSRYRHTNGSLFALLDDYLMVLLSFGGIVALVFGLSCVTTNLPWGLVLIFGGILTTPVTLFFREKSLFRSRIKNKRRKFLSLLAVTSGLSLVAGLPFLVSTSVMPDMVLAFIALEGFLLLVGGLVFTEGKVLVSLRDIL